MIHPIPILSRGMYPHQMRARRLGEASQALARLSYTTLPDYKMRSLGSITAIPIIQVSNEASITLASRNVCMELKRGRCLPVSKALFRLSLSTIMCKTYAGYCFHLQGSFVHESLSTNPHSLLNLKRRPPSNKHTLSESDLGSATVVSALAYWAPRRGDW